jgi:hypothetical protein
MGRCRASVVRTIMALCLVTAATMPGRSEDEASHITKLENRDFDGIDFKGQSEFEIHDPNLLPKQLVRAIEQTSCPYKEDLKALPVRFLVIENRRFVLVPCFGVPSRWHEIFHLQNRRQPKLMQLPIMAAERGFVAADSAGFITWNKDAQVFEATRGSDMCTGAAKHVYRIGRYDAELSLIRIDIQKDNCGGGEWETFWTASEWFKRNDAP